LIAVFAWWSDRVALKRKILWIEVLAFVLMYLKLIVWH
jgi:hypothetical protein